MKLSRRRVYGTLFGVLIVVYLLLWLLLSQPDFRSNSPSASVVSAEKLKSHVKTLSVDFAPRNYLHLINTKRTADYIKREFDSIENGVVTDQWFDVRDKRYRNVSLLMGDSSQERIVVGAHYDSHGQTPGADDNASGVAGLIELAKLFGKKPIATPIEFVGYPLEEPPFFGSELMGSWQHAAGLSSCKYMISIEMIGYFSDERGSQNYPLGLLRGFYPSRGNYIAVVGNLGERRLIRDFKVGMKGTTDLPVQSISAPVAIGGFQLGLDFSDHRNYWAAGYPAIMITDTAFFRNTAYHTPEDTYDRLDYEKMAMVVKGIEAAIRRLEEQGSMK